MKCRTIVTRLVVLAGLIGLLATASTAHAGAIIDLRPNPPMPPGGYAPNTIIEVDVFLSDLDNPSTVHLGSLNFQFANSAQGFGFPGPDRQLGTVDDNQFQWEVPTFAHAIDDNLPQPSWYIFTSMFLPFPPYSVDLPDDGEVRVGSFVLDVGLAGGLLDVVNINSMSPADGAHFEGGAAPLEPSFFWSVYTGELQGGQLQIVVPEPATIMIVAAALVGLVSRRFCRA